MRILVFQRCRTAIEVSHSMEGSLLGLPYADSPFSVLVSVSAQQAQPSRCQYQQKCQAREAGRNRPTERDDPSLQKVGRRKRSCHGHKQQQHDPDHNPTPTRKDAVRRRRDRSHSLTLARPTVSGAHESPLIEGLPANAAFCRLLLENYGKHG